MAKKILEVALQGAGVRHDGDKRSNEVGDNILIAQLLFSRTLVSDVLVSTRALSLKPGPKNEQSVLLDERTLGERLLFKKWVEGPVVGLKLEVTDKDSGSKVAAFLLDAMGALVGAGGSALKSYASFVPFSGLPIDSAVSFAKGQLQVQSDRSAEEKVLSLGEAWIDIPTDKVPGGRKIPEWTEITADLIATANFNKIVYVREKDPISSKPQWRTRVDKKVVVKKGSPNGWVKIAYRVYAED
jgi:hypothetical protein